MSKRYECKLSPEALQKAVKELHEPEDNSVRLAAIDKLRTRFQEEAKDLDLYRSDDDFLLRFLRVRKFNEDAAYKTLLNYHLKRTKECRDVFELVENPKSLETLLRQGPVVPLRNVRAKDGTYVLVVRPGHGFKEKKDLLRFIAIAVLGIEKFLEEEEVQIYGLTVIEDMSEFGFTMALQMASYGKKFLSVLQEAMPMRVKSLNFVKEALVFDAVYAIMSKFMKEKMKRRLQLHGSRFDKLHEKIDPSYLPSFLGGTGPALEEDWWANELLPSSDSSV